MAFTKRPGFAREQATGTPIEGAELDADGNLIVTVMQGYSSNPSKVEEQFLARELEALEVLKDIRAEMARMNFMLMGITGINLEREDFLDGDDT